MEQTAVWLEIRQGLVSWGGVALGSELGGDGGVGVDSTHNKWQFSVWSGWLPSTGPLDCRGLLGDCGEDRGRRWIKTGRMAPVKGQLTNGALSPSIRLAHKCTHRDGLHYRENFAKAIMGFKNSNKESEMEEITGWVGVNKAEQATAFPWP